jgi:hypothetical protein
MRKRSERAEESARDIGRDNADPACREGIPSNRAGDSLRLVSGRGAYPYSRDEGGEAMSKSDLTERFDVMNTKRPNSAQPIINHLELFC